MKSNKYVAFIREKGLFSGRVLQPSPGSLQLPSARQSIHGCWEVSQTSQPSKETLVSNEGVIFTSTEDFKIQSRLV